LRALIARVDEGGGRGGRGDLMVEYLVEARGFVRVGIHRW